MFMADINCYYNRINGFMTLFNSCLNINTNNMHKLCELDNVSIDVLRELLCGKFVFFTYCSLQLEYYITNKISIYNVMYIKDIIKMDDKEVYFDGVSFIKNKELWLNKSLFIPIYEKCKPMFRKSPSIFYSTINESVKAYEIDKSEIFEKISSCFEYVKPTIDNVVRANLLSNKLLVQKNEYKDDISCCLYKDEIKGKIGSLIEDKIIFELKIKSKIKHPNDESVIFITLRSMSDRYITCCKLMCDSIVGLCYDLESKKKIEKLYLFSYKSIESIRSINTNVMFSKLNRYNFWVRSHLSEIKESTLDMFYTL